MLFICYLKQDVTITIVQSQVNYELYYNYPGGPDMPRGVKTKPPTHRELKKMSVFQRKLFMSIGNDSVNAFAKKIKVSQQRLDKWIKSKAMPNASGLLILAAATGLKADYWTDDTIPPRPPIDLAEKQPVVSLPQMPLSCHAAAKGHSTTHFVQDMVHTYGTGQYTPSIGMDAIDPHALEIHGDSAFPLAADGQAVVFDHGKPSTVKDGDVCVAEVNGELVLKRRSTSNGHRIYLSINPEYPPIVLAKTDMISEYPVIAIIMKTMRSE